MNEDAYHTAVKPSCSGCSLMLFRANFRCYFAVSRFFRINGTFKLVWTGLYLTSFSGSVKKVLIKPWSNFLVLRHQGTRGRMSSFTISISLRRMYTWKDREVTEIIKTTRLRNVKKWWTVIARGTLWPSSFFMPAARRKNSPLNRRFFNWGALFWWRT